MPVMRLHHGVSGCGNWTFDSDSETLDHYRRWASIHILLTPYFRFLLNEARVDGLPIVASVPRRTPK